MRNLSLTTNHYHLETEISLHSSSQNSFQTPLGEFRDSSESADSLLRVIRLIAETEGILDDQLCRNLADFFADLPAAPSDTKDAAVQFERVRKVWKID